MSLAGAIRNLRVVVSGDARRPLPSGFTAPLAGERALEIGGPSSCFEEGGVVAVYPLLAAVDCVQPRAQTTWHNLDPEVGNVLEGTRRGRLVISDDIDLGDLPADSYDAVICSHVIEHIANPLRALSAWRRVTRAGGHLLMAAPHMEGTFDHRRATTPLDHMVADERAGIGEDDLTHLKEFLELHDSSRNVRGQEDPEFVAELRDNANTRLLHHHTFTTRSLLALLDRAGLQVLAAEARLPHDIFILGSWPAPDERPDNAPFLSGAVRSPFRADRRDTAAGRAGPPPTAGGQAPR